MIKIVAKLSVFKSKRKYFFDAENFGGRQKFMLPNFSQVFRPHLSSLFSGFALSGTYQINVIFFHQLRYFPPEPNASSSGCANMQTIVFLFGHFIWFYIENRRLHGHSPCLLPAYANNIPQDLRI